VKAGLIAAWRTNHRATVFLVERLPSSVWRSPVPGIPRLTVGMIAAHGSTLPGRSPARAEAAPERHGGRLAVDEALAE
jgi:hypothetical protein